MPQLVVAGPLDERHLHDDRRPHPVRAQLRQALRDRERRLRDLDRIETLAQIEQQLGVEAGADLSGEHEVVAFVVADQQRAEADARALRIGEAADHQLLRALRIFIFSQCFERRCSYGEPRRLAITPSQPSRRARSHGSSSSSRLDAAHRRRERQRSSAARDAPRAAARWCSCRRARGCRRRDSRCVRSHVTSPSRITFFHRQSRDRPRRRPGCSAAGDCANTASTSWPRL